MQVGGSQGRLSDTSAARCSAPRHRAATTGRSPSSAAFDHQRDLLVDGRGPSFVSSNVPAERFRASYWCPRAHSPGRAVGWGGWRSCRASQGKLGDTLVGRSCCARLRSSPPEASGAREDIDVFGWANGTFRFTAGRPNGSESLTGLTRSSPRAGVAGLPLDGVAAAGQGRRPGVRPASETAPRGALPRRAGRASSGSASGKRHTVGGLNAPTTTRQLSPLPQLYLLSKPTSGAPSTMLRGEPSLRLLKVQSTPPGASSSSLYLVRTPADGRFAA